MRRLVRLISPTMATVAAAMASLAAPAALQGQRPPALEILGPDSVTAALKGETVRQTVFLRNPSSDTVPLRIGLAVQGDGDSTVVLAARGSGWKVPAASVTALDIVFDVPKTLRSRTFGGYLVVADARTSLLPAARWTSVSPPRQPAGKPRPQFGRYVLLYPFLGALLAVIVAAVPLGRLLKGWMLGTPTWDFAKSWASTTTVATAFANTALVALIPKATQDGLAALAAVFAVVVLIAPSAYNLSLHRMDPGGVEPRYKGLVFFYLFASLLTLWGVLGALYCGYLLVSGIPWEGLTADRAIRYFQVLPLVIGFLVFAYGIATIRRTVREQAEANQLTDEPEIEIKTRVEEIQLQPGGKRTKTVWRTAPLPEGRPARGPARPAFPLL